MPIDLLASARSGGSEQVVRTLISEWWGIPIPGRCSSTVELLDWIRSDSVLSQIAQPQDRLLPLSDEQRIDGRPVVAQENQAIWEAVVDDAGRVVRYEDQIVRSNDTFRREHIRLDGSQDVAGFLVDVMLVNAHFDDQGAKFRATVDPSTLQQHWLSTHEGDDVSSRRWGFIAGVGWFGSLSDDQLRVKTTGGIPNEIRELGSKWTTEVTRWVDGDDSGRASPWSRPLTGWVKTWEPVEL